MIMVERKKIRIVYMGTPEFAVAPLERLVKEGYDIAAVVTVPDKPAGRGLKSCESDIKRFASANNLPLLQPPLLKEPTFIESIKELKADLFIVVAFRMLPKVVWSMPPMGTFNLHGSLLPQYRGAAPINWAIINGEQKSGVTTFLLDEKIDTGAILLQKECLIEPKETVGTLYDKLMVMGADLVSETVEGLSTGLLTPKQQSDSIAQNFQQVNSGAQNLKEAPKITKEICRIKWDRPAEEIERLIRGLSPYPCAYSTMTDGNKSFDVKIFDAECNSINASVTEQNNPKEVGNIETDNKTYLNVICQSEVLAIKELQVAGKKRIGIKEFLLGFRNASSYKFVK
jgi:methionyl-tRNA formyltransferase